MRIIKRIVFGLILAAVLVAQEAAPPPADTAKPKVSYQNQVFVLKYADARSVANVLSVFGVSVKPDRDLHVVAVSAPADVMPAVEEAVKRLDVPAAAAKDVEISVYMIGASEQAVSGGELPADLQPVANELKRIFSYKGLRLLDSILLRTQPGKLATTGGVVVLPNYTSGGERQYHLTVAPADVTEDARGHLVRLDNLELNLRLPDGHEASIRTEISVREGQRVVVGKSDMGHDQSLILVVTAKVTE